VTAAAALRRKADAVAGVPFGAMVATAKAAKAAATEEARRAGVATLHLPRRGKPDRLVRLRAVDTIREATVGGYPVARLRVQGVPVGPWVWVNTGTGAHLVGAGRTRGARTTAARLRSARKTGKGGFVVFGPDQVRRVPVWHPGARGRLVWRRVQKRIRADAPDLVRAAVHEAVRRG